MGCRISWLDPTPPPSYDSFLKKNGPSAIKSEDVYALDIYCCNSSLNDPTRIHQGECVNIMTDEEIGDFSKKCDIYYDWLINHRGQIIDRSAFHKFITSGGMFIRHAVHQTQCSKPENNTAPLDGMEKWFSTLLQVYEANIFNPNQTRISHSPVNNSPWANFRRKVEIENVSAEYEKERLIELFPDVPLLNPIIPESEESKELKELEELEELDFILDESIE